MKTNSLKLIVYKYLYFQLSSIRFFSIFTQLKYNIYILWHLLAVLLVIPSFVYYKTPHEINIKKYTIIYIFYFYSKKIVFLENLSIKF